MTDKSQNYILITNFLLQWGRVAINWKHLFFQQQQNLACFQNKLLCRFPKKILYGISHKHYAEEREGNNWTLVLFVSEIRETGMRPCKLLGWGRDLTLAMLWILKTIKLRTIKYNNICPSPSIAGSFYTSFTLLNGSSHQTLNVLHLRFIFTSQLHKAGLQCCKALLHRMLACWGGEHCQMCPVEGVWKVSAPASDIDICVQCLGLCQMRDSDNVATVRLTRGRGWGSS